MKTYIVDKSFDGTKLDKFIKAKVNANNTFILMMLRKKQIKINGVHPKDLNYIVKINDEISFYLDDTCFKKEEVITPRFDIIYEDENILIIDKDKKIKIHSNDHHDLVSLVNNYLSKKNEKNASPVNRLDQNTSGLIIFSKNSKVTKILSKLIEEKEIKKEYLALCYGKFEIKEDALTNYYIFDDEKLKGTVYKEKIESSKEIITGYKVIKEINDLSLIQVTLYTGRTHQIRAHMSYIKHPIIGDNKYGNKEINKKYKKENQELVSYKLTFNSDKLDFLSYLNNKVFVSKKKIDIGNADGKK